jgi:hypothetical protein
MPKKCVDIYHKAIEEYNSVCGKNERKTPL